MMISCTNTYETKGDSAYRAARKAQGDVMRKLNKEAYLYYRKAIMKNPARVRTQLRNRFIEMTLARAEMVLDEGSAEMDALPLFQKDIDDHLTQDVNPDLKERYAAFLVVLADSSFIKRRLYEGLKILDKAIGVAINKAPIEKKKKDITDNFARENFEAAEIEHVNGKTNEDAESLVRAEFMTKVALLYDPNYPGVQELLSTLYKENRGTYSAYDAVVTDKPDTNIYDQVNKFDILLAVPDVIEGRSPVLKVDMYNYSCNPQRLRAKYFALEDENGKSYPGLESSKIEKEILDQEHETKMTLRFNFGGGKIKKLTFKSEDGEHYTEKLFF
jgi:hypothetical protein